MKTKKRYTLYSNEGDITFIMEDIFINGEVRSTEVIGFHYGEPNEDSISSFSGKRKAQFEW